MKRIALVFVFCLSVGLSSSWGNNFLLLQYQYR